MGQSASGAACGASQERFRVEVEPVKMRHRTPAQPCEALRAPPFGATLTGVLELGDEGLGVLFDTQEHTWSGGDFSPRLS